MPNALSTVLSYAIALSVVSFLHVVVGELAPKTLAIQYAEKMTLMFAPGLYWFGQVTKPIIHALNGSSRAILGWFGIKPTGHEIAHSEEELKLIVTQSYESGEINQTELAYLKNIFAFDNRILKEIMIPREQIVNVEIEMSLEEMLTVLDTHEYTRYPVTKDGTKLVGYVNTKEMLTNVVAGRETKMEEFIHEMPIFFKRHQSKMFFLKCSKKECTWL